MGRIEQFFFFTVSPLAAQLTFNSQEILVQPEGISISVT